MHEFKRYFFLMLEWNAEMDAPSQKLKVLLIFQISKKMFKIIVWLYDHLKKPTLPFTPNS